MHLRRAATQPSLSVFAARSHANRGACCFGVRCGSTRRASSGEGSVVFAKRRKRPSCESARGASFLPAKNFKTCREIHIERKKCGKSARRPLPGAPSPRVAGFACVHVYMCGLMRELHRRPGSSLARGSPARPCWRVSGTRIPSTAVLACVRHGDPQKCPKMPENARIRPLQDES